MSPRPKKFIAVSDFRARRQRFTPGDVVTGAALADCLNFGDRFVVSEREYKKIHEDPNPSPEASQETNEGA